MYYAVAILAAVVLPGVVYTVFIYNRLTILQNQLREGWSGVDVQLKRRHDLIPNLVQSFPSLLVARSLRFSAESYFEVETSTDRATPEVKL